MPEPAWILTLSWEDIVRRADSFGIRLTRDQTVKIFETLAQRGANEVIMDGFWTAIDIEIEAAA